ncbi:MAG: glycosyltransferase family 2 protein [Candidatus Methanoperedens sp.]
MKFQNLVEIFFPGKTRRRRCYDFGLMSLRTIANEGLSAFLNKSLRFLHNKNNDTKTSYVPILEIKGAFVSPLSLEKKIYGIFQSSIDQLTEIRIITTTYQRKNADISFILRLSSENGGVLRRVKIPGQKILDNAYTSFKFKPINDSKGKIFYFEIKSTGKPSAAVWYDPDQISTKIDLYHNDKKLQGTINFQAISSIKNKNLYEIWISCNEPNEDELKQQRVDAKKFNYIPLISIITPVYNTTPNILKETIQSVLKQTYDNWELCIVDGNSKGEELKNILTDFSQIDKRIHVNFLDQNLGISGNSNKALQFAKGEFISLLDHDDLLAPFAIFEMVKTLNQDPELDFIYSDKDIISEDGKQRLEPLFKPDWSPEIMLSTNYLTHLCVIRKSLVDKMGGFLSDTDGAQDWELFMRVMENTNKIHHISKILYHWRESETSCALAGSTAKPYIFDAQRNVLHNHLKRLGKSAELILIPPGIWRIKWAIKVKDKISIIIPTKDNIKKLKPCVESILNKSSYQNFEIIIIDTGSKEPESLAYNNKISINTKIKIINYNKQFNYSAVNNLGEKYATGEILLFLNDDTEVITSDWLEEMAGWIQQDEIGVVGAKLLKPDNTIQHAGVILGMQGFAGHPFAGAKDNFNGPFGSTEWYRDYLAVTGACMMIRKKVFEEAGGFSESFILMGSDVELCLRIGKKGYRIVCTPFAKLVHHEASTRNKYIPPQDFILSYEYYEHFLKKRDPYYNINLSLWNTIPSIRMLGEKETIEFVQEILKSVSKKT